MATEKVKLKRGMGGSRCGKGRTAGTAVYKHDSKKLRRRQDGIEIRQAQQRQSNNRS